MLPGNNHINNPGVQQQYLYPVSRLSLPLEDWEMGGVDIANVDSGLTYQLWHLVVDDAGQFKVTADDGKSVTLFQAAGTSQAALAFDQQMQPVLAWIDGSGGHLRYFVNSQTGFAQINLPADVRNLRLTLDEKRAPFIGNSDVLLSYMVDNTLMLRVQREGYNTEHTLATDLPGDLVAMGITRGYRMQWRITE